MRSRSKTLLIVLVALAIVPAAWLAWLWMGLPDVSALRVNSRAPSSRIVDRNGRLLYELLDPRSAEAGRHAQLALERMPAHLRAATIAVEDASFYHNPGVDVIGILRALWIDVRGGEALAGGSTITQQLARQMLLEPAERRQRTLLRKLRELLLAWRIAQRYSKDEVLELYLNEIYYGNLAYGVEAAARTYFGKSASDLDLAESALLAGLPQSPVTYDPFENIDAARKRQRTVLTLMMRAGAVTEREIREAEQEHLQLAPAAYEIRAPHFVAYVRNELEQLVGPERLLAGGLIVTTTLDLNLQDAAQDSVRRRLHELAQPSIDSPVRDAGNAAVLALEPDGGAVRIMVGSPDYFDAATAGAVNATLALRQPGSAIKPVTYAAAFARVRGFTAATPLIDVRTSFPTREGEPYVPLNYDRRSHGIVSARSALATSNNVAAVQVLQQVGVENMVALANDFGMGTFSDGRDYGLALTLGGGEVRLIDLTAAYAAFAAGGEAVLPYAIVEVRDVSGKLLYAHDEPVRHRVLDARVAWLISDILADNTARAPAFGESSVLRLDRLAAVKTGTSTDFRDNWTVGYVPQIAVGVWVGNADGSPMRNVSGVSGAGPIWNDVMRAVVRDLPVRAFSQPEGLVRVRVCTLSGMLPSANCLYTRWEWFIDGTAPTQTDTWYRREAGRLVIDVPASARSWALLQGWPLANAPSTAASSEIELVQPDRGAVVRIDSALPREVQQLPLEVRVRAADVVFVDVIMDDGEIVARFSAVGGRGFWKLMPGEHTFIARAHSADGRIVVSSPVHVTVLAAR